MRSIAIAILTGAGIALIVACGAMPQRTPPRAVQSDAGPLGDPVHARITELDQQIAADRDTLGILGPSDEETAAMSQLPAAHAATECTRSARDTCTDVCRLGDSICDNAQSICELADQLPGDTWAADRCNAGKASCKTASERCCGCM